jgi:4-amino-4-deoxy-L-arabinose transferase-like glycosyltransferase
MSRRVELSIVATFILAYCVLAGLFSLGPVFEGPDEYEHFTYARAIANTGSLPNPAIIQEFDNSVFGEFHQPPLYYLLAAPIIAISGDEGILPFTEMDNPYYPQRIDLTGNDNKNSFFHAQDEGPLRGGYTLAVHAVRGLSILIGVGTLLVSYQIFLLLWSDSVHIRLLALGIICFWPQFIYLSGSITNDVLSYFFITSGLALLLRQIQRGSSTRIAVLLGIVLGLGFLTKLSTAFMLFPVGLAVLLDRRAWRGAVWTAVIIALLAGWWYVRNYTLYGDPTGVSIIYDYSAPTELIGDGSFNLRVSLERVPYAYDTLWARFGSIPVNEWFYRFYDVMVIIALIGVLFRAIRGKWRSPGRKERVHEIIVLICFALVWVVATVYWSGRVWSGNQGRFLLPGISIWGAGLAWGIAQWVPQRGARVVYGIAVGCFAFVAFSTYLHYFRPAFSILAAPETISHPLQYRFEDAAELIGVESDLVRSMPGDTATFTLYWRAISPTERPLQAYLHSIENDLVRRDSMPATGNLLSTDWRPGQVWSERYVVEIPGQADEQQMVHLIAGLYDPVEGKTLDAIAADGTVVTPIVGRLGVGSTPQDVTVKYEFGEVIGLASDPRVRVDDGSSTVCLDWVSLGETSVDYHVFVHLVTPDGELISQHDGQPRQESYPTSVWQTGEAVEDCIVLNHEAAVMPEWTLSLGLYSLGDNARLPLMNKETNQMMGDHLIVPLP